MKNEERISGAGSARRLLDFLLQFNEKQPIRTAADLSQSTGVPASTTYRYLSLLRSYGLVEEVEHGAYRLTPRFIPLARAAQAGHAELIDLAHPVIDRLAHETGETTLLIRNIGWSAVCVDRVESPQPVRLSFDPGEAMPLHAGSAAKVLLAAMTPEERDTYAQGLNASRATADKMSLPTDEELDAIRQAGWAESFGEVDENIWGASAAVEDGNAVVGALGIAGPLFRLDEPTRSTIIRHVRAGAVEISDALRTRRGLGSVIG